MQALGLGFWKKFLVWDGDKIAKNPLAILDPVVGLLELVGEFARILSFSFRLLGNIFAGQVLLFVIASLLPIANLLFWHLEFAVGILQAVIFALLTLTFMSGAVVSHHGDEEHH
jgi:F-type H+-transporting ATPase subunit a